MIKESEEYFDPDPDSDEELVGPGSRLPELPETAKSEEP